MKVEIKVPSAGESVVEATVGTLLKPNGSIVKVDEEILELETDKLNQVVYATAAGKLEITVKTGDVVKVGQVIGTIDSDVKAPSSETKQEAAPPTHPPQKKRRSAP